MPEPQWTVRIGRVSQDQHRVGCGKADAVTGSVYNDKGDRLCGQGPAAYRVQFSSPGQPPTDRYLCVSCAAAAAERYGHQFPPGPWVDAKPPAIGRPP